MSYRTYNMVPADTTQRAMGVSLTQHAQLPQMLRQSNYLGTGDMRTANVNFRVKPHSESAAPAHVPVQRDLATHELYPTQSTAKQQLHDHDHDWRQHEIVASVAGLHTKLAELDSEVRKGASADAPGAGVMRQVQDHASLLREHAKLASATQSKHRETTALTHRICSQIHDSVQLQSTALEACSDDLAALKSRHSAAVGLTHSICEEFQKGLLEQADESKGLHMTLLQQKEAITLLQKKDVVAQALLGKMLTMLDQHDSAVSNGKPLSQDHMALLDTMCEAFEKTKRKMQTFEQTQLEMQQVIADFKAAKLAPSAAYETEALQPKLDRYLRLYNDIDRQCTQALQQHGAKMDEMHRAHEKALHEQRMKMQELERAQQRALDEHQGKMQLLERKVAASQSEQKKIAELENKVHELALQQLNQSQGPSISRVTERDVKLLKHEIQQMHGLKKQVEETKADLRKVQSDSKARNDHSLRLHSGLQDVKSTVSALEQAQQANTVDRSIAEMHSRMLDMKREQTLQNIKIDRHETSLHDVQCKLAA